MDDLELLRYARHILLEEVGIEGQEAFLGARVFILGVGGLGSTAALYLATSGVGHLTLVDDDTVELSNLQRQILHPQAHLGLSKVESAKRTLAAYNPGVTVHTHDCHASYAELLSLVSQADVVLDCCDNFATRYALNRACVAQRKPLVSGAAMGFDGQVAVFDLRQANVPCYYCLFPEKDEIEPPNCATTGVLAPLVGIVGSMQAAETLKLIAGIGRSLSGRVVLLNAREMLWRTVIVVRDPDCRVCVLRSVEGNGQDL